MRVTVRAAERSRAAATARAAGPVLALWLVAGTALAQSTGRVKDWFVMTDELYYERLAISIAHSGSPLPHLHGQSVPNVDQLLPLLLAPFYRGSLVPAALHAAHLFDAFAMTSAVVPAYLLARRVAGDRRLALAVAALTVAVPWTVYANQLLTEVVAYPAFLWAVLGIQRAVAEPRPRNDLLALGGIALATLARTQMLALLAVPALAVAARAVALRQRPANRVLAAAYGVLAAGAVALALGGGLSRALGTYRAAGEGSLVPPGFARGLAVHLAAVALATAVLPFLAAAGWALARAVRPRDPERASYAVVVLATLLVLAAEVTSFDLRYAGSVVEDRYLFYAVPLVLVGLAAALVDPPWPTWALAVPGAVVAYGFLRLQLPAYPKLNFDQVLAVVDEQLVGFAGSAATAQRVLAGAAVVGTLLLVEAALLLRRRLVGAVLAALVAVALPAQTGAAFSRYFSAPGTSGRPLTLDQGVVFDWIDRTLGTSARVAMVPYPVVAGDYWAGTAFWWDAEFWNQSVRRDVVFRDRFYVTSTTFPKLNLAIDPRTGRTGARGEPYAAQAEGDARFRLAGVTVETARGVDLIRTPQPWRASWLTSGLYQDGWTFPGRPATVRVFPLPGQRHALVRYLDVRLRAPSGVAARPYRVAGAGAAAAGTVGENTIDARVQICVPAAAPALVRVTADGSSRLYGEPDSSVAIGRWRSVGVQVAQIGLADELGPAC